MKKVFIFLIMLIGSYSLLMAQTTPISSKQMAVYTVQETTDTLSPYYKGLGVRRVIVADANGDGEQEILATDYTNGGRVHVMKVVQDSLLEIIWSSPAATSSSGSTPRFIQVGDCDGDGNKEIIFEQNGFANPDGTFGRIALYEWNGSSWGDEAAFSITSAMVISAGYDLGLRFTREVLTVADLDGDGKTEIIPHTGDPYRDVIILGVNFSFPGFASIVVEGGSNAKVPNNAAKFVGGSHWNSFLADVDGDGKKEIINHHWDKYGFWSIDINGKDSYTYPTVTDIADAAAKGAYHTYSDVDAVSYFGAQAVDVDGDGKDEIVGTQYGNTHNVAMMSLPETATGVYRWTDATQADYSIIKTSAEIAALGGKKSAELWPIVKGDLNKDGKDELYTGGGRGLNLVAIQYKGDGSLLDPASYDMNLVYNGEGGEVFATWEIYNGSVVYTIDTIQVTVDSVAYDTTNVVFDSSVIDTVKKETPFTAYIFADSVDLDNDGNLEIVLADQSVYDSISVDVYDWVDTSGIGQWTYSVEKSYKTFNNFRQTVRVLEYNGGTVGLEHEYGIITPEDYKLDQNYPNPFNPSTQINFALPLDKKISLKIYDMVGQEVKTLIDSESFKKGQHQIMWNGTNNNGSKVASGHYIAKLTFGNFAKSIKMTLMK
ncbi:MAG: T9SS type A sorting domain-containing protein [Ignavibacteriales bacterium]|nr:T9SS type A sorting domain-containing protein [Ignavibacteriales bacterium]